ncbi:MAG: response regulator [Akkermansiaceae bacterium]|nr:response regulator [Verrucomicrobiales bacterium]
MKDRKTRQAAGASENEIPAVKGEITVLHVDDDANDTALMQAASRKAQVGFQLLNVSDGEEAIAYLCAAEDKAVTMPSLVLLDMKMPRASGVEILHWIRQHPKLNRLPVIVLSGSELQEDIRRAYAEGANSYLVKPLGFEALVELIRKISSVWLNAKD